MSCRRLYCSIGKNHTDVQNLALLHGCDYAIVSLERGFLLPESEPVSFASANGNLIEFSKQLHMMAVEDVVFFAYSGEVSPAEAKIIRIIEAACKNNNYHFELRPLHPVKNPVEEIRFQILSAGSQSDDMFCNLVAQYPQYRELIINELIEYYSDINDEKVVQKYNNLLRRDYPTVRENYNSFRYIMIGMFLLLFLILICKYFQ